LAIAPELELAEPVLLQKADDDEIITIKVKRCPNGTRRNKKTMKCEEIKKKILVIEYVPDEKVIENVPISLQDTIIKPSKEESFIMNAEPVTLAPKLSNTEDVVENESPHNGYTAIPLNEAMAIIYAECSEDQFSGLAFSFGRGCRMWQWHTKAIRL